MDPEEKISERHVKEFPKGQIIFKDGDPGLEMYVIQTGKVRISKTVRDVEKTLVLLGPGEFFGEMSILNNLPRSATATVEEDAKLLVIDPKTFEVMVRSNTEIAVRLIKKLSGRLQEANEQIENLLLKDHNSKVVHFLAHLSKTGKQEVDGVRIDMTSKELAGKMGIDVQPVDDVLSKLVKAKLIQQLDTGIIIKDAGKLREFLEFLEMKEKFGDLG